jgi:hypothetical protein
MNQAQARGGIARGVVIRASGIPVGFGRRLERAGLAGGTCETFEGMYLEPRASLTAILALFDAAGVTVAGISPAGPRGSWRDAARRPADARHRLTDRRSAEGLPTLPAA